MRIIPLIFAVIGAVMFICGLFLLDWNDPAVVFAASGVLLLDVAFVFHLETRKPR